MWDFSGPVASFVQGFPEFILQLIVALVLFTLGLFVYALLSPHRELRLVHAGNPSAALAFAGVVAGLAIPLGSCLSHSLGLFDFLIWGLVVTILSLLIFRITDMLLRLSQKRMADGDVASAVFVLSVRIGLALIISGAITDPPLTRFSSLALQALG